jgi:glycosyltransferase involved in cell wall biosynthesis
MERYLEIVLPALAARGIAIHVVAREIDAVPAHVTAERASWSDEHDPPDDKARRVVERSVATHRPDAVLAANVMDAGVVAALRRVPRFMYQVHDHRPLCPNGDRMFPRSGKTCTAPIGIACAVHALTDGCAYGPRPSTLGLIRRRRTLRDAIAAADIVTVASRYVADRAAACGIAPKQTLRIPPPLADDAFGDVPQPHAPPAVFFAGRMVPQKGLLSLVRALALIPPERRPALRAFGDGPERDEALRTSARLGVALDAPGAVDPAAVRAGLDACALAVMPSLWEEPFGMAGIEAFARTRPVVAYRVGGVPDWLDDETNGLAVGRADERALSVAIDRLLCDEELRVRLGARARSDAERYRLDPIVDALHDALTAR